MHARRPLCSTSVTVLAMRLAPLTLAVLAMLGGCGASTGGGGGASSGVGGKVDTPCNAAFGEGCYATSGVTSREACTDGKWVLLENCAQGTVCQEKITVAGQAARTTECKLIATAPGSDASGEDAKTGADGNTKPDGQNPGDAVAPSDTFKPSDSINSGDAGNQIAQIMQCAQTGCPSQWSVCQSDPACMAFVSCFGTCTADTITCANSCQKSGDENSLTLLTCAQTACSAPVCGNGKCESGEQGSCPSDCVTGPVCGNGTCESGETSATCPADCPVTNLCGNGKCDSGETPINCQQDCSTASCCTAKGYKCGDVPACGGSCGVCSGATTCNSAFKCVTSGAVCGNGTCESSESNATCPSDCPATQACGDLVCQSGETTVNCPFDCPPSGCNNGTCASTENATTCPQDCDPATKCMIAHCKTPWVSCVKSTACAGILSCIQNCSAGDTTCGQSCYNSATAAGQSLYSATSTCMQNNSCNATTPTCGNGTCETGETNASCPSDCPATSTCGDGTCDSGETNATCPSDCPATSSDPGCAIKTSNGGYPSSICQATLCGTQSGATWTGGSDTYCCNSQWDSACVNECKSAGAGCP